MNFINTVIFNISTIFLNYNISKGVNKISKVDLVSNVKHYRAGYITESTTFVLAYLIHLHISMSQQSKDLIYQ
jgi:hypothetical protein